MKLFFSKYKIELLLTLLFFYAHVSYSITSLVKITDGGTQILRDEIGQRLSLIINSFNDEDLDNIKVYCTPAGYEDIVELREKTECRNVNALYESKLLELPDGNYEVRDIKVKVKMAGTEGNPYQYLVFTIDQNQLVTDVRYAMEQQHYQEIISQGELIKDFIYRQPIVQFLEIFRTAYNRKDLEYLKKVYSEDALIIVGRVLKEKKDDINYLENSFLSRDRIQFIRLSKREYIDKLEKVFTGNAFVKVRFDSIDIKKSPVDPKIYGVMLKQYWNSSTYHDEGYLFLMLDFRDAENPIIHVRSWQPEKFSDGSVVNLGDFIVVPGAQK